MGWQRVDSNGLSICLGINRQLLGGVDWLATSWQLVANALVTCQLVGNLLMIGSRSASDRSVSARELIREWLRTTVMSLQAISIQLQISCKSVLDQSLTSC